MFKRLNILVFYFIILLAGASAGISVSSHNAQYGGTKFKRQSDEEGCILPPQPDFGSYTIARAKDPPVPGQLTKPYTFLKYKCDSNFILNVPNSVFCMKSGKWSLGPIECLKTCPPLVSASINYYCSLNGLEVPCIKQMAIGTKADVSCKRSYTAVSHQEDPIICKEDGKWETSFVTCTPDCGTLTSSATPYQIKGSTSLISEFPWHAEIFEKADHDVPLNICGGSIISSSVVISAAHCFWNSNSKTSKSKNDFAVGYGKVYQSWKDPRDLYANYSDIKRLILHPEYQDAQTSYAHDIAIVILKSVIEFNNIIKPICVDWMNEGTVGEILPGTLGKVTGWDQPDELEIPTTEAMQYSTPVDAKVLLREDCRKLFPENFEQFFTHNKICVGYANGSDICRVDSGGSFSFAENHNGRMGYYLQGILSIAPNNDLWCNSEHYALFTTVSEYLPWLKKNKVHTEHAVFRCNSGDNIIAEVTCDEEFDCPDQSDEAEDLCNSPPR